MGPIDEADADQRVLGAKQIGIDGIQLVPAHVVVSIAGGSGKVALCHAVFLKCGQDPLRVFRRNGVDAGELLRQARSAWAPSARTRSLNCKVI